MRIIFLIKIEDRVLQIKWIIGIIRIVRIVIKIIIKSNY